MSETKLKIPLQKIPPETVSPKNLILFSKPKTGKTEAVAHLPNNLILDFEHGSKYIEGLKIEVNNITELREIGKQIEEAGNPYTFVTIDTITALEKLTIPYAEDIYSKTAPGKNWFKADTEGRLSIDSGKAKYGNILNMPEGAGYRFVWDAHTRIVEYIKKFAPYLIQLGHIKDVSLDKSSNTFASMELDLTGKLKRIVTSSSDAIGYMYRKGNENIISFKTTDEVACGARPLHLSNKEIIISEKKDDELITYWDRIYPDILGEKVKQKSNK